MKGNEKSEQFIHPALEEMFIEVAWKFLNNTLYNNVAFDNATILECKAHIMQHLRRSMGTQSVTIAIEALVAFCERVVMTREHLLKQSHRCMPYPSYWLSPDNAQGFAKSRHWLKRHHKLHQSEQWIPEEADLQVLQERLNRLSSYRPIPYNTGRP